MTSPRSAGNTPAWIAALAGGGAAVVGLPVWFEAVKIVGDPGRATTLLTLALVIDLLVLARARTRFRALYEHPWSGPASLALAGVAPLSLALGAEVVAISVPGGPLADGLLVGLWGLALLVPLGIGSSRGGPPAARLPLAVALGAATLACLSCGPLLAAGTPAVALSAVGALALWPWSRRRGPSAPSTEDRAAPHEALAIGVLAAAVSQSLPPLLAAYAGAVPQGALALAVSLLAGWACGSALLPSRRPDWLGPVLVGVACLTTLAVLSRFLDVAALALGDGSAEPHRPLMPWLVIAAVTGLPVGLGAAAWRPTQALRRPGWLAAGLVVGWMLVLLLGGRGVVDLPVRVTAGLASTAAMGLLIAPRSVPGRTSVIAGWIAAAALIGGLVLWQPLPYEAVPLDAAARFVRMDPTLVDDLDRSTPVHSGFDRSGARCAVATPQGVALYRGGTTALPGRAGDASESMAGLLPVVTAADAGRALVVEPGRGGALVVMSGAALREVRVVDRSPFAAAQIAGLDETRRDAVTGPAIHFGHHGALPTLRASGEATQLAVVNLPPPGSLGSEGWYGRRLPRAVARSVSVDGWVAFRVPTRTLDPADLAGVVVAFDRWFPGGTIWVDPAGHGDVILLGSRSGERPDADRLIHGLERRGLQPVARRAGVQEGHDLLRRVFAGTDAAELAEAARAPRGLSWRAGRARLEGRVAIPLLAHADAAAQADELLDMTRLSEEERARVTGSGRHVDTYWPVYLTFLDRVARQQEVESLEWAQELRASSDDPTADLAPLVRETIDAGRVASERGLETDAQALFLLAEAFSPEDPEVHEELGRLAWAEGKDDEALRRFEAALERDPRRLVSLLGAAEIHLRRGESDQAREWLNRAVEFHPDSVDALYNLARLELQQGRADSARSLMQQAYGLDPTRERVVFGLAEISFLDAVERRGRGEPYRDQLAQARLQTLQALDLAREPSSLCLYGQIQLLHGDLQDAEAVLTEALELAPEDFDTRAALGEVYLARHQYAASARQFQEAQRLRPDDIRVQQRLAQLRNKAPYAFEDRPGSGGVYSPAPDEVR